MTAHIVAFAQHQAYARASLLELHRARKLAKRLGAVGMAAQITNEINRRLEG